MLSAVMLIGSSVFSVGSVVFPPRSLVRVGWDSYAGFSLSPAAYASRVNNPGCLVVVLVLASAFLHVKISIKVFRVYLGMVTCFWSTFVIPLLLISVCTSGPL